MGERRIRVAIETIGEAWTLSWRVHRRCGQGTRAGMKSIAEGTYGRDLDVETLVCPRGRDFPLAWLAEQLRCPRCGSRREVVLYEPPAMRGTTWAVEC